MSEITDEACEKIHVQGTAEELSSDVPILANGWLTLEQSIPHGKCRKCRAIVESSSGSLCNSTPVFTPSLITTPAGEAIWKITRLCEPCAIKVFYGDEYTVVFTKQKRLIVAYRDHERHQLASVLLADGKLLDIELSAEDSLVLQK
jgi:hypothetical protein